MKRLLYGLVALALVACELEIDVNGKEAMLSNVTIECIDETTITNNTSANNEPFTKHTYLCRGFVGGFRGECEIRVLHNNFILFKSYNTTVAGLKMPFEFTFTPEWAYLDEPYNNFVVEVVDADRDELLCKTSVVVTKHPDNTTEEPTDVPYMEYSLWGTECNWQLPDGNNSVIIVNSDEELKRYIASESGEGYPTVDFTKYTMIIAYGYTARGIYDTYVESLQQTSETEYTLNINVVTTDAETTEKWTKALLVDKFNRVYNINLNVDVTKLIN